MTTTATEGTHVVSGVTVTIGERMNRVQMAALPDESVMSDGSYDPASSAAPRYIKRRDMWTSEDTGSTVDLSADYNYLVSIGPYTPEVATFASYRQRFVAFARNTGQYRGGSYKTGADEALMALGASPGVSPGEVVATSARPPVGTVAMYSYPGGSDFTVLRMTEDGWVTEHGRYQPTSLTEVVVQVAPEPKDEPVEELTEEENEAAITVFKSRVWYKGWEIKARRSWCAEYEGHLADFGITERDALPFFDNRFDVDQFYGPPVMDRAQRNDLPDGTVLGKARGLSWGVWHKVGGRWTHVMGPLRRLGGESRVLHHSSNGSMKVLVRSHHMLRAAPVGTVMESYDGRTWEKEDDGIEGGVWTRNGGRLYEDAFTLWPQDFDAVFHFVEFGS